jgi:hypothetical protein
MVKEASDKLRSPRGEGGVLLRASVCLEGDVINERPLIKTPPLRCPVDSPFNVTGGLIFRQQSVFREKFDLDSKS